MKLVNRSPSRRTHRAVAPGKELKNPPDRRRVAAVGRAIDVLLAFQIDEDSLSLTQLAERTGMYKSTILRLIFTLEERGFIARQDDGNYRLGPAFLRLGTIYQKPFRLEDIINPQLHALVEATGESASFFVSDGTSRYCLSRVQGKHEVRHHVEVGVTLPLNRGSTGKILTTFAAGADPASIMKLKLPVVTIGSSALDIAVIAGPVFGVGGKLVGAVAISGPTSRFEPKAVAHASKAVLEAVKTLTSQLGGNPGIFGTR